MKTTKLLAFVMLLMLTLACKNNDEQLEVDQKNETTEKKKLLGRSAKTTPNLDNSYYEEDIHAFYVAKTLTSQYLRKKELLLQIEEGNDEAMEELEHLQQEIRHNKKLQKHLYIFRPRFPLPPPPKPCAEKDMTCFVNLTSIKYLLLAEKSEGINVTLKTADGEIIGENGEIFETENFEGLPATLLKREDFSGEVVLTITKFFAPLERTITYEVNAIIE